MESDSLQRGPHRVILPGLEVLEGTLDQLVVAAKLFRHHAALLQRGVGSPGCDQGLDLGLGELVQQAQGAHRVAAEGQFFC